MLTIKSKFYQSSAVLLCAGVLLFGVGLNADAEAQEKSTQPIVQSIRALLYPGMGVNNSEANDLPVSFTSEEPEDLVLAVIANRRMLSAGVFAVQEKGRYYLPVTALANVFGFPSRFNIERQKVEGSVLKTSDDYFIDGLNNQVSFRGKTVNLPPEAVLDEIVASDDVYVLPDVLEEIWPLELRVNLQTLVLEVEPDQKLPFQDRLERKARQEAALERKARRFEEDNFPFVPLPYQAFSKPVADISTNLGYSSETDNIDGSLRISGANDLAYASADYSASLAYNDGRFVEPENIRLRFRRQNIYEGALPLGLEDVQVGDVGLRNRQLIGSGFGGRGFNFSTEREQRTGEFDRITIDGVGNAGWEVELYRNNELIEFGQIDERGEYVFENIPVVYGNNRFRIALYGPQGQVEERIENYAYRSNMLRQGETAFQGGVVDLNRAFVPVNDRENDTRVKGIAGNVFTSYGLKDNLTTFASANLIRDNVGGETIGREYITAGGITNLGNFLTQAELYKELEGGEAVDVRTISNFKGFSVNGRVSAFNDFTSPIAGDEGTAKKLETEIGIAKGVQTPIGALGLDVRQNYLQRESGPSQTRYNTRLSLGRGGTRYTNRFLTDFIDDDHEVTNGIFSMSSRLNKWNIRNTANYEIYPDLDLSSLQTELRYFENKNQRNRSTALTAGYNLNSDETRLGLQISEDLEKYIVSGGANWSSKQGLGLSLRASTSLGPYGPNDQYLARSRSFSQLGPVNALMFKDANYDGMYNDGDEPIEGAKISAGNRLSRDHTDENGMLTELLAARTRDVNLRPVAESVEDPYLVSAVAGYKIRPRPGVVHKLDFPFVETGAIDGTLFQSDGKTALGGVVLQLLDDQGNVIKTSQTAPDGYFTFEQIPPGNYTIRPDPKDELDVPTQFVSLTPDNLFQFGTDIVSQIKEATPQSDVVGNVIADLSGVQPVTQGQNQPINDGLLNADSIASIARNFKENQIVKGRAASSSFGRAGGLFKAVQSKHDAFAKATKVSLTPQADIRSIRLGQHANKERIVLDLSGPLQYTILHDEQNNLLMVEMPSASLSATADWTASKAALVKGYQSKAFGGQGVLLTFALQNRANVGASGLLKASAGKPSRLYIDIER